MAWALIGTRSVTVTGARLRLDLHGSPLIAGAGCRIATAAGSSSMAVDGSGNPVHGMDGNAFRRCSILHHGSAGLRLRHLAWYRTKLQDIRVLLGLPITDIRGALDRLKAKEQVRRRGRANVFIRNVLGLRARSPVRHNRRAGVFIRKRWGRRAKSPDRRNQRRGLRRVSLQDESGHRKTVER